MHHPGGGIEAKVSQSHSGRCVYGGQQPQKDDGEEATNAKEYQDTSRVHNGTHKEQQAKQGKDGLQRHGDGPAILLQRRGPERQVPEVDPVLGVVDREPDLVHGLEALWDVEEDVVRVVHDLQVGLGAAADVGLERAVVQPVHVLLDVLLQDLVVDARHLLDPPDNVDNVVGGLFKLGHTPVEDVVPPEAPGQAGGRHQGKEAQDTSDGAWLAVLGALGVTASGT